MENISILFYTNNLLSRPLLKATTESAITHAKNNGCELIITSHYPISNSYIDHPLGPTSSYKPDFDPTTQKFKQSDIYNYIIKDLKVETSCNHIKTFVVGKLHYSYESIYKQILFSLKQCSNENIVLMEHDCLYPKGYIEAVKKCLVSYQYHFAYCSFANCFLSEEGFFDISLRNFLLSSCSGKKDLFQKIFSTKLKLLQENKKYKFEPLLDIEPQKDRYDKEEVVIEKHLCADKFLDGPILDIRHQLNSSPNILVREGEYLQEHEYWGNAKQYIDMIRAIEVEHKNAKLWSYGTARQDY